MLHILALTVRNSVRNPLRTTLTVAGIAIGVIAFSFLQTVLAAYYFGLEASSPKRLVTRHRVSLFNLLPLAQATKMREVPGVSQVSYGVWFGGYYQDPRQFFGQIAVDPQYLDLYPEFVIPPDQQQAYLAEQQACIVGRKLANRFNWKVGDKITITGQIFPGDWDFIIRGIYHGATRNTDETSMFFHWKRLDEWLQAREQGSQVGWYLIGVEDASQNGRITATIDDLFFNSTAPTLTETEKEFNASFVSMFGSVLTTIKIASGIVIGIILLIMANTMMMAARERITEYGVLKTLGFRGFHLAALIGGEALVVTFLGAVLGCAASYGIVALFGKAIEMNLGQMFPVFELRPSTVSLSVAMALAAGLVACLAPIARSVRLPIAQALRRVE